MCFGSFRNKQDLIKHTQRISIISERLLTVLSAIDLSVY